MRQTSRTIHGKVADLIIEEAKFVDDEGRLLGYVAAIYIRAHGQTERRFVRKTRLPETAEMLAAAALGIGDVCALRGLSTIN